MRLSTLELREQGAVSALGMLLSRVLFEKGQSYHQINLIFETLGDSIKDLSINQILRGEF